MRQLFIAARDSARPRLGLVADRGLHLGLGHEARAIAPDGGQRGSPTRFVKFHAAVVPFGIAVEHQLVPAFGVTDVRNGQIVVRAPEERDRGEIPTSKSALRGVEAPLTLASRHWMPGLAKGNSVVALPTNA